MNEITLLEIIRAANAATAERYAELISINFAMVAATFYFLNRSTLPVKLIAYVIYLVGMLMFVGLMLEETNLKALALATLAGLSPTMRSPVGNGLLQLQQGWLFKATAILLNTGLWLLPFASTWLLFVWRKPINAPGNPEG